MLRLSLLTAVGRLTMMVILKRCDGKFVGDFDAWSTRWTPPDQPDNIYDTLHEICIPLLKTLTRFIFILFRVGESSLFSLSNG